MKNIILSINCVLSYIESGASPTLIFVPETQQDTEKLLKHNVTCKNQFRVKLPKKTTEVPIDLVPGTHMNIMVKCIKYKFTQTLPNGIISVTHEGTKLTLIKFVNLKIN